MSYEHQLIGVGSPIVDSILEVDDAFLAALGRRKGGMELVDSAALGRILAGYAAAGAGEPPMATGGSAANTIIAVSQLGGQVFYSSRVADDEMGRFYLKDLASAGVATRVAPQPASQSVTGKCLVLITPDAERTMNTFLGASAELTPEDVDVSAIANSGLRLLQTIS